MIAALDYIIQAVSSLVIFVILLRFWLPWFRVDFRNPVAQGILKLTSPLVIPLRRILPPIGRVDTATVVVVFAIQYLTIVVRLFLVSASGAFGPLALTSIIYLGIATANLFMLVIIVHILLGWFAPGVYNPVTALVSSISNPLLSPFRRLVPPLGGFDITPVIPLILLGAATRLLMSWAPIPI